MPEAAPQRLLKAQIGTEVPVIQHECIMGNLELIGAVRELVYLNIPNTAVCKKCGKNIPVDYVAWRALEDRHPQ